MENLLKKFKQELSNQDSLVVIQNNLPREEHLRQYNQIGLIRLAIWNKGPLFTDRDYLNNTNNAGYYHPIKTLDCRIGQFHWSDLKVNNRLNAQITHF